MELPWIDKARYYYYYYYYYYYLDCLFSYDNFLCELNMQDTQDCWLLIYNLVITNFSLQAFWHCFLFPSFYYPLLFYVLMALYLELLAFFY